MALPDTLLIAAKNYLNITWDDAADDLKLVGILSRGIAVLNRYAGTECDYTQEDLPRQLLLDYARYAWSEALDEYTTNFLSEILTLQNYKAVEAAIAEGTGDEQE